MVIRQAVKVIVVMVCVLAVAFAGWAVVRSPLLRGAPHGTTAATPQVAKQDTLTCINALPDAVKIAQKLMVAGYGAQLGAETGVLGTPSIGGIIAMDAATAAQLQDFRKALAIPPFIAVDQEGGTVQRYTAEGILPGAEAMASNFSAQQAYSKYLSDDKYLKSIGITTNLSPVVGVISGAHNPLPGRLFSANPTTVITYASAAIRAAKLAGITPVVKHFPGLGSATGNTDYGAAITDPYSALQTRDLLPFKQLAALHPDAMVGNVIVPGLTGGQPAVWSPQAVKALRDMGYQQAVVYSDSLTARAIPGTLPDAVVKAWQAGIDVALIVQTPAQTPQVGSYVQSIMAAANTALKNGTLKRDQLSASVARIFARKGINACKLAGHS